MEKQRRGSIAVKNVHVNLCVDCVYCRKHDSIRTKDFDCAKHNRISFDFRLDGTTEINEQSGNWRHCKDAGMQKGLHENYLMQHHVFDKYWEEKARESEATTFWEQHKELEELEDLKCGIV